MQLPQCNDRVTPLDPLIGVLPRSLQGVSGRGVGMAGAMWGVPTSRTGEKCGYQGGTGRQRSTRFSLVCKPLFTP